MAEQDKSGGWRWHHTLIVICGFVVCLVGGYAIYITSLRSQVAARIKEIKDAGYPVTLEDLNRWPSPAPPPSENAATVYEEAFLHLTSATREEMKSLPVVGDGKGPGRMGPIPPEMRKAIEDFLAKNKDALDLLHKAAALQRCRFAVDWRKGVATNTPHFALVRESARRLRLEGMMYAEDGKGEMAVRSVKSGLALGRSLAEEPTIIGNLVRVACDGLTLTGLGRVLTVGRFSDEQLAGLAAALEQAENARNLKSAFAGDRCLEISIFEMPPKELAAATISPSVTRVRVYFWFGWHESDELFYLDIMSRCLELLSQPLPDRVARAQLLTKKADAEIANGPVYFPLIGAKVGPLNRYIVSSALLPGLPRVVVEDARIVALFRAARTAVAVERFRLKTGRLPGTLAELVPDYVKAIPEDPFDGKPLRYKVLARGYVVYSISENGVDDGGTGPLTAPYDTKDMSIIVGDDGPPPPPLPPTPSTTAPVKGVPRRSF